MRSFTEQEKPLYRWKLTDDKRIIKHVITNWDLVKWGTSRWASMRYEFRLSDKAAISHIKSDDLDVMLHGRYYSFDNDDAKVRQIFLKHYVNKVSQAQAELDKNMAILEEFKKNNPEGIEY